MRASAKSNMWIIGLVQFILVALCIVAAIVLISLKLYVVIIAPLVIAIILFIFGLEFICFNIEARVEFDPDSQKTTFIKVRNFLKYRTCFDRELVYTHSAEELGFVFVQGCASFYQIHLLRRGHLGSFSDPNYQREAVYEIVDCCHPELRIDPFFKLDQILPIAVQIKEAITNQTRTIARRNNLDFNPPSQQQTLVKQTPDEYNPSNTNEQIPYQQLPPYSTVQSTYPVQETNENTIDPRK
ncbi:MAG: hypothetical protein EZS28_014479 [Streblomastix strix]|uniref:Uncharacterized protein n=1 Tax=Streblomastix strix TaxID=222440 RepID=A0A5J4W5L2_9EUKA|nr:MAG: hypothetical protein EZS28_014479 [Streblomastix strix]